MDPGRKRLLGAQQPRRGNSDEGRKRGGGGREGRGSKKEKGSRTKIDKTSLWIPAACTAGRPHCSKCPARYEIMSVCIPRHKDNLSRLRPVEYLLSAFARSSPISLLPRLCFLLPICNTRAKLLSLSLSDVFPRFSLQSSEQCSSALRSISLNPCWEALAGTLSRVVSEIGLVLETFSWKGNKNSH